MLRTLTLRAEKTCYAKARPSLRVRKMLRVTEFMDDPISNTGHAEKHTRFFEALFFLAVSDREHTNTFVEKI